MTTAADDILGLDFDEVTREEARSNRPSFRNEPIKWRGHTAKNFESVDVTYENGTVHPKVGLRFSKTKFLDVGNAVGVYDDGQDYMLLMDPVTEEQKAKRTTRFSVIGKTTKASGADLKTFLDADVEAEEIAETYKNRDGYDRQSYHWKLTKVAGSNGTKPAAESIPADLIEEVLTFIDTYGEAGVNHLALAPAIMQNQVLNKNKSLNDQIMAGKLLDILGTRVTVMDGVVRLAK